MARLPSSVSAVPPPPLPPVEHTTRGLGAGGYPQVGEKAANEQRTQIKQLLEDLQK